jgi:phosphate:Na+ symporter
MERGGRYMITILLPFCAGLSIFLVGMKVMRNGLESLAEKHLKTILLRFTKTPWRGMLCGTILTSLLQSSTAVTVFTIGLVDTGLLTFTQSLGIILGTNIGTTVTTQLLALKLDDFAWPLIAIGFILILIKQRTGPIWLGLGFIFAGVKWMQSVAAPLEKEGWIDWLMSGTDYPILMGFLTGMVITALIHSSSAMVAIAMGFYASGVISLPFAIAVVIGSNVGTCATGLIAALQTKPSAKRVAIAHLVLNVGGAFLFLPLIPLLLEVVSTFSADPSIQVAHTQTIYNVVCSLMVLPVCAGFARLVEWMVPERLYD